MLALEPVEPFGYSDQLSALHITILFPTQWSQRLNLQHLHQLCNLGALPHWSVTSQEPNQLTLLHIRGLMATAQPFSLKLATFWLCLPWENQIWVCITVKWPTLLEQEVGRLILS